MFFLVSKLAWYLVQPIVAILVLLVLGLVFLAFRRRRTGTALVAFGIMLFAVAGLSPLGLLMTAALEDRFPRPMLPARVDGVVVLGGSFDTRVAKSRGEPELNEAADRVTEALALARRYPEARVIFSGGIAAVFEDDIAEVDSAKRFFLAQGLAENRLMLEGRARNTVENAVYAKAMAQPKPGEVWLLVTSAAHMPRSVGCFRVAGFDVVPYPTDYQTPSGAAVWRPSTATVRNLEKVHFALREYIGLAGYWLTGKTDALFPAPETAAPPVTAGL